MFKNKKSDRPALSGRIFVTGGAGFLARGLYRRALAEKWSCSFTAYSRDDAKHVALQRRYPDVRTVRGDIADVELLAAAMAGHDLVIHAAAVKYVDLAETNVWDTIRVNVDGSRNVALAAGRHELPVIAISTDKACEPANVYGCTKMAMERLFIDAQRMGLVEARICRYGNVVASTGSVIPKLTEQLERTGRVTVTDPDMTRYWMSVDQAVDTILETAAMPFSGATVVPDPAAMRLIDVVHAIARDMRLVDIVGLRPGEKRHESLVSEQEAARATRVSGYTLIAPPDENWSTLPTGTPAVPMTSEKPSRFIRAAEMTAMIEDARDV